MRTIIYLKPGSKDFEYRIKNLVDSSQGFKIKFGNYPKIKNKNIPFNRIDFLIFGMIIAFMLFAFIHQ